MNQEHQSDPVDDVHEDGYYDEWNEAYGDSAPAPTVPGDSWSSYYDQIIAESNGEFTGRQQQQGGVEQDGDVEMSSWAPPPDLLVLGGGFNDAKDTGTFMDRWLVVHVQSGGDWTWAQLDVWSDDLLARLMKEKFLLWQEDQERHEGQKVCAYYNLDSLPAIVVVDPITGKKMHAWTGDVTPEDLYSYLLPLSHQSPREHLLAPTRNRPSEAETSTTTQAQDDTAMTSGDLCEMFGGLNLGEELAEGREGVCSVGVRLPDGRRLRRRFREGESTRMLWAFCWQHLEEEGAGGGARGFHFVLAAPGNSKLLAYDDDINFREANVSNTLITLVWD